MIERSLMEVFVNETHRKYVEVRKQLTSANAILEHLIGPAPKNGPNTPGR